MKRGALLLASCAALASPLAAEITPIPGEGDPHIQSVPYDPAEVVAIRIANGYAVTVRLAPDERIETVTLGDSGAWQVQVNKRADSLVIKPAGAAMPTNLTVLTDQRVYNFALYEAATGLTFQPYLLTFTYAVPPVAPDAPAETATSEYRMRGERALWPLSISNDGEFTHLRWAEDAPLPAVYRQLSRRKLALVNGTMRDGEYVIEGVPADLVFILGRERATATLIEGGTGK